ncbi:MAG: nuclear transport factor 2 family protein [Bauldia sp.]|nr:nuclear transport factor 2 family protein [Bauldia sp.]
MMTDHRDVLMDMYRAFNERDMERATEFLAPDVDWPNAETGGREHGRTAVRAYWEKQWTGTNPRIEPLEIDVVSEKTARVRVHQFICALDGAVLDDRKLEHLYTFDGNFVSRMVILAAEDSSDDDGDDYGGDDGGEG